MKPGVTLAMIVRNDAERLRRCLESARPYVQAIVVVDTGSTDSTVEVAESFDAQVIQMEWPDAFDVARNVAFDAVKTQWTLWLDSDEWLIEGMGDVIVEASKLWEASAYYVTRIDFRQDGSYIPVNLIRLWRTHPKMRVLGIVHENFPAESLETIAQSRPILQSPIQVGHDGYSEDMPEDKLRRNASLLRRQLAERDYSFYHEAQLYYTLMGLSDPEGASGMKALAQKVVATWPEFAGQTMTPMVLGIALAESSDEELQAQTTIDSLAIIEQTFPFSPASMWEAYRARMRRGERERAHHILLELKRRGQTGDFERINAFSPGLFEAVDEALKAIRDGA